MRKFAICCIDFYQKHISPRKGYVCVHRYYHGGDSCSEYAKKSIIEFGLIKTIPLFFSRLRECEQAYKYIEKEQNEANSCSDNIYNVVHSKECGYACEICSFYGFVIAIVYASYNKN
jgi:putative component of membrane protein insertase Oxa1/YidC/SpoIIIJ protein YidD